MEYTMSKKLKTLYALVCAIFILSSTVVPCAIAADDNDDDSIEKIEVVTYVEIPLYKLTKYIGTGIKIGEVTYVPLFAFCQSMLEKECDVLWDSQTCTTYISADGLELSVCTDNNYMLINGRAVYLPQGVYNINGTIVVPIRELAAIFNARIIWNDDDWSVDILKKGTKTIEAAESFYDEEDLYWLSHVIHAESGNQSLEGMIGVGNVVLNRVADESGAFPDSVQEVIFQYGQFSVVETGSIYMEPNALSVVAAKLCLEGANTVGDSLFFLNPEISSDTWFRTHRSFVMSLGDHDFYA